MDTNESSLCRPGGFALTRQMFQFAGIEIPEAGAAETESTDPAVPFRVIDIGCGTGGTMRWLSEHFPGWQISGLDKNPDVHEPGWQIVLDSIRQYEVTVSQSLHCLTQLHCLHRPGYNHLP